LHKENKTGGKNRPQSIDFTAFSLVKELNGDCHR